jgi:hypothetical protein
MKQPNDKNNFLQRIKRSFFMSPHSDHPISHDYTGKDSPEAVKFFVVLSRELTGFSEVALYGTGQVLTYYHLLRDYLGKRDTQLETVFHGVSDTASPAENEACLQHFMQDGGFPAQVAATLIKLWYLGQWYDPTNPENTMIPSSHSYASGLVWDAIQAHPQGAKQQGFGAWSFPPLSVQQDKA